MLLHACKYRNIPSKYFTLSNTLLTFLELQLGGNMGENIELLSNTWKLGAGKDVYLAVGKAPIMMKMFHARRSV